MRSQINTWPNCGVSTIDPPKFSIIFVNGAGLTLVKRIQSLDDLRAEFRLERRRFECVSKQSAVEWSTWKLKKYQFLCPTQFDSNLYSLQFANVLWKWWCWFMDYVSVLYDLSFDHTGSFELCSEFEYGIEIWIWIYLFPFRHRLTRCVIVVSAKQQNHTKYMNFDGNENTSHENETEKKGNEM